MCSSAHTGCGSRSAQSTRSPHRCTTFCTVLRHELGPLIHVVDDPGQWTVCSVRTSRLVVPPVKLSIVDSRAFPVAAAQIWNALSVNVISASTLRSFQQRPTEDYSSVPSLLSIFTVVLAESLLLLPLKQLVTD